MPDPSDFTFKDLVFKPWKLFVPEKKEEEKKKGFEMPELPEDVKKTVLRYGNRITSISNGRKHIDFDFED
jgi:hypothetical protein